jgi:hypothetical protein
MTIAQLFHALFNLGAQTDFWNSTQAARDFWMIFGAVVVAGIVYAAARTLQYRRTHPHTHPFGHSFSR